MNEEVCTAMHPWWRHEEMHAGMYGGHMRKRTVMHLWWRHEEMHSDASMVDA